MNVSCAQPLMKPFAFTSRKLKLVEPSTLADLNVITFKSASVLGSTNFNFLDVNAKGFINGWAQLTFIYTNAKLTGGNTRSEERRVGKEWRSRWSPYH